MQFKYILIKQMQYIIILNFNQSYLKFAYEILLTICLFDADYIFSLVP